MRYIPIGFLTKNWVLIAAVMIEVLGLLAAFGAIPGLTGYTAWMLAATGILSCTGVVIVTVYFMYQYNRRPLNVFQREEIEAMLSDYIPSEELRKTFLQKAPNDGEFAVFWMWRYQKSIMEFAWASHKLADNNGYVLVGELEADDALFRIVHHSVVPPPISEVGASLSSDGEMLPEGNYMNWRGIFESGHNAWFRNPVVLYKASDSRLRVLRPRGSEKVVFSEERASPMLLDKNAETHLPTLVWVRGEDGNPEWSWASNVRFVPSSSE